MPHTAALPDDVAVSPDRVLTIRQWATLAGIGYSNAKRLLAEGQGPRKVRLSPGRTGITLGDHRRWLAERAEDSQLRVPSTPPELTPF